MAENQKKPEVSPELEKFLKLFNTDKIVTPEDIEQVTSAVGDMLLKFKKDTDDLNTKTKGMVSAAMQKMAEAHNQIVTITQESTDKSKSEVSEMVKKLVEETNNSLKAVLEEVRNYVPKDGKDADIDEAVEKVLEKIRLPEYKEFILKGEDIVDLINELPTENDEDKIDWKHIKNAPKPEKQKTMTGGSGILGVTSDNFVVSKDDTYAGHMNISIPIQPTAPTNPFEGQLWIDNS